jgi:hypothetical protein
VEEFKERVSRYLSLPCPAYFGRFEIEEGERQKPMLNMHYINMFDTLPDRLRNMDGVSPNSTQVILDVFGKYAYQGIKKLATTRHLSYSWVLWADSEGVVVQPFNMTEVFDKQIESGLSLQWCYPGTDRIQNRSFGDRAGGLERLTG